MKIFNVVRTHRLCEESTEASRVKTAALAVAVFVAAAVPALAEDDAAEISPAPAAIGADVPATYFGPQPSQVQRELVGEYQNLKSGKIDFNKGTITLPLYEGAMRSGQIVWYIVTDTDDKGNADQLGINYSPKLTFADVGRAVRKVTLDTKFKLLFESGTVDLRQNAARRREMRQISSPPRRSSQAPLATRTTLRSSRSSTRADTSIMRP
jgi:hypothetical protein